MRLPGGANPAANAVFDEFTASQDGAVYVPFTVPNQRQWHVTGLLIDLLATASVTPAKADWEIRQGVSTGNGGTLIRIST